LGTIPILRGLFQIAQTMANAETDLLINLEERVLTLTLNRPNKLNALSEAMIMAAIDRLRRAVSDPAVGAIVITGSGRGFCAGGDVSAMAGSEGGGLDFEQRVDRQNAIHELSQLLWEMPKITIAAVNGVAGGRASSIAR
jgi:2-(1,2-epoxy-1,2-dihydrophenyl)acetyl-CoA isomerase